MCCTRALVHGAGSDQRKDKAEIFGKIDGRGSAVLSSGTTREPVLKVPQ